MKEISYVILKFQRKMHLSLEDDYYIFVAWYKNGVLHRKSGPAEIYYDNENNFIWKKIWIFNGKEYKKNGLIQQVYDKNGFVIIDSMWISDDQYAEICYFDNTNQIFSVIYADVNKQRHNDHGPAMIYYNINNDEYYIAAKRWFFHGDVHRDYGPAYINFDDGTRTWIYKGIANYTTSVEKWILEKKIILSKENDYEIPDEYKVEFKLRFH